jgi:phage baseplate assembly protein W
MAFPQGSWLKHPIQPDVRGTLATQSNAADMAAASIMAIIETRQGERVMVPDYGIPDFVFSVVDAGFAARLAYFLEQQVLNYEPLVATITAQAGTLDDGGAFLMGLGQGRVAISVTYTVRGSNTPLNLVYPVWQLAQ